MINSDINYIQAYENGTFTLHDTFSTGYSLPKDDVELGGTYDFYNLTSFEDSKGYLNITFERLFDTKDKYDIAIFPVNIFFKKINLKIKERNHSYYNSMGK